MKKTYIIPSERIAELGLEGQLLDVSGNAPDAENGGGLDQQPSEDLSVRAQYNLWNNEW